MRYKKFLELRKGGMTHEDVVKVIAEQLRIGEFRVKDKNVSWIDFLYMEEEERHELEFEITPKGVMESLPDLANWLEKRGFEGKELEQMKETLILAQKDMKKRMIAIKTDEVKGKRRIKGKKDDR